MAPALDAHHAIMRKLIAKHKCYEVKTIGDSFMCALHSPEQALEFACQLQLAFHEHDWGHNDIDHVYYEMLDTEVEPRIWNGLRVRVGLHFGQGSIKLDPTSKRYDYYGTVVNSAARIESVCHGGQVGMSQTMYEAVRNKSPNVVFTDLGPVELRGLPEPLHMWQALPQSLAGRTFPALRVDKGDIRDVEDEDDDETDSGLGSREPSHVTSAFHERFENHPLVVKGSISARDMQVSPQIG